MKRFFSIIIATIIAITFIPMILLNDDNGKAYAYSNWIKNDLFPETSTNFDTYTAWFAAELCNNAQGKDSTDIRDLLEDFEFTCVSCSDYGADYAYTIASAPLSTNTTAIVVIPRGTTVLYESFRDFATWDTNEFYGEEVYGHIYGFKEKVWNGMKNYAEKNSDVKNASHLKILVTGHSLGGATAGLIAAQMNNEIGKNDWFSSKVRKSDIYCYTFGAIKTLKRGTNISKGYENIHNIYNYYDSYGPYGIHSWAGASSPYAKYGHTELYKNEYLHYYEPSEFIWSCTNHSMDNYIKAVDDEYVTCSANGFLDKPSLKSVSHSGNSIKATWKKSALCSGYDVRICASNSRDDFYKKRISNKSKTSYTFKKLDSGTKYYVEYRTYYKRGNKVIYSNWSEPKSTFTGYAGYYLVKSGNTMYCAAGNSIYKVNLNTKEKTCIVSGPGKGHPAYLNIKDGYLYYCIFKSSGVDNDYIHRIKLSTGKDKLIGTGSGHFISGNKIYCLKWSVNYSTGSRGYKMNLDGSNLTRVKKYDGAGSYGSKSPYPAPSLLDCNDEAYSFERDYVGYVDDEFLIKEYLVFPDGSKLFLSDYYSW